MTDIITIDSSIINAMNLQTITDLFQDLYDAKSIVDKDTMVHLQAKRKALLSAQDTYDLGSVKSDDVDSSIASSGGGSGGSFQVIEWDPITIEGADSLVFTPYSAAVVTETSVYSTEVNPDIVNVGGSGFDIEFAIATATVSNNLSGTFTVTGVRTDVYTPMMVTFSKEPITATNLALALQGGSDVVGVAFQVINLTAYYGSPQDTHYMLNTPSSQSNTPVTTADVTRTHFTINNGVISAENTSINVTVDFDTYNIMSVIAFGDFIKTIGGINPNPVIPVTFINELVKISTSASAIPDEAVDGTVLKVIGHDGLLLGAQVLINDECTLFDDKQDFLLNRPFETNITNALSDTGVIGAVLPEIQILSGTTDPIYMTKPVSILNHTALAIGYTTPILINDIVREGTVTIINRTSVSITQIFACPNAFKITPYGANEYVSNLNAGYPGFVQRVNTSVPAFTIAVYRLDFSGDRGVIRGESFTSSETTADLSTEIGYLTLLTDANSDGTIQESEQNDGAVVIRVSTVGKKSGYKLRLGYGSTLPTSIDIGGVNYYNYNQYTINTLDITTGYVDITLNYDPVTSPTNMSVFAVYQLFNPYTNQTLVGDTTSVSFEYQVITPPSVIRNFDLNLVGCDTNFTIQDPDILIEDSIVSAVSTPSATGTIRLSWGSSSNGGADPVAGDIIHLSAVGYNGGQVALIDIWYTGSIPTFPDLVNGSYAITQSDVDASEVILSYSIGVDQQFTKITANIYHDLTLDETTAAPAQVMTIYTSATTPALNAPAIMFPTNNLDTVDATVIANYSSVTNRAYYELLSGETTTDLQFLGGVPPQIGQKIVVTALVSDLPNSGFGSSAILQPDVSSLNTYTVTQDDVDFTDIFNLFPITFATPDANQPYFVRMSVHVEDGAGTWLSVDSFTYFLIYPLIDAPTFDASDVTSINNPGFEYETVLLPTQTVLGDTLRITDDTNINYTPAIDGIPVDISLDSNAIGDGNYPLYPYFPYNGGVDYVKEIYARVFRNNVTGVPIKGKAGTQTITTTFG